jgi:hypothetical protein
VASSSKTLPPELADLDLTKIAMRIRSMSDDEKREFILSLPQRKKVTAESSKRIHARLKTPDELWEWIRRETGVSIPRVAVCEDHCAPFDFVWDAYSNSERALLLMANREGGKTLAVSIVHYVNAETKPKYEGITFGAILPQAQKAYKYIKSYITTTNADGEQIPNPQIAGEPTRSETKWKSGSSVGVIVGTISGVNSPHPNTVHADEIDIMDRDVYNESRNMSGSSGDDKDRIPGQDIATSTRKSSKGLMQEILDEVADAIKKGHKPAWKVYIYCIAEVAKEVSCCRAVDPVTRVRRLVEVGEDPGKLCECDRVVKGEWDENTPRTLESVCAGRFFRSRGWMYYEDIVGKFMQNSQTVWEAQMECRRPSADGIYLPTFTRERFGLRLWVPRPEFGQIWMGVDWGGGAASAVLWIQGPLRQPVEITGYGRQPIIVPQRAYVVFDEIHQAGIGATKLADEVVRREIGWRQKFNGWKVAGRFADMAGRQQRDDWREHDPPLWTGWHISRDFSPTVDCIQGLVKDLRWFVDVERCPNVLNDAESWRQKNGKEVEDASTHSMASNRYCVTNVEVLDRRKTREKGSQTAMPVAVARPADSSTSQMPAGAVASSPGAFESERWRQSMGIHSGNSRTGADSWRV